LVCRNRKSNNKIDSLILENGLLTKLKKSVTSILCSLIKSFSIVYFADTISSTSTKQQSNIRQGQFSNVRHLSIDDDVVYEKTVPAKCVSKSQTSSIQQRLSNEVIFESAFAGNGEKKQ